MMKYWIVAGITLLAPLALAFQLSLTAEEMDSCKNEGGCSLYTQMYVEKLKTDAYAAGKYFAQTHCIETKADDDGSKNAAR